jgi:hypothetical protein
MIRVRRDNQQFFDFLSLSCHPSSRKQLALLPKPHNTLISLELTKNATEFPPAGLPATTL